MILGSELIRLQALEILTYRLVYDLGLDVADLDLC